MTTAFSFGMTLVWEFLGGNLALWIYMLLGWPKEVLLCQSKHRNAAHR
jgi:hypothetical protein